MNREIKFRAFDIANSDMLGWEDLCLCRELGHLLNDDILYVCMQFTGLLDKSGKEIYEGDIIDEKFKWVVSFEDCAFYAKNQYAKAYLLPDIIFKRDLAGCPISVIGNIYQNPDLINL